MNKGVSGPTQAKIIRSSGTGLSDEAVSFLTANASPFTNPRDLPAEAKVPDPRRTETSNTAFIWAKFDIPGIKNSTTGVDTYEQMIMTSADPFAPCPLAWGKSYVEDDVLGTSNFCPGYKTPNTIACDYEDVGISAMVNQLFATQGRAKAYRIVGHGLKVWCSRNTNIQRGTIETGQFTIANSRNSTKKQPFLERARKDQLWSSALGTEGNRGVQATMLQSGGLVQMRKSIENAKEQEFGFYNADEGAICRWTDSNAFEYQPVINKMCVYPLDTTYRQSFQPLQDLVYNIGTAAVTTGAGRAYPTVTDADPVTGAAPTAASIASRGINELCTINVKGGDNVAWTWPLYSGTTGNTFHFRKFPESVGTYNNLNTDCDNYLLDPKKQFDKGLYADIRGFGGNQVISVQVCWHIEYLPVNGEPWFGTDSPVDPNFDMLAALARDRHAFPIHQAGGVFFSNFQAALRDAVVGMPFVIAQTHDNEDSDLAGALRRRRLR